MIIKAKTNKTVLSYFKREESKKEIIYFDKIKVAIISQFRDEAKYLKEWIEFHLMVGFDKFYLIDHCSNDNPKEVLQPYIDQGVVVLYRENNETNFEDNGANNITRTHNLWELNINRIVNSVKEDWFIFLNQDEFIFTLENFTNIKEYLLSVPVDVGHVGVCNKTFSHNDYVLKEKELLIEKLIKCGSEKDNSNAAGHHCWTKSFVKKSAFESYTNVHYANIKKDYKRTDVLFDENNIHSEKNRTIKPIFDKIRINHYRWRDYHYAFEKVAMYEKWGSVSFTLSLAKTTFEDDYDYEIHKYLPELKERMGIK